MKYLLTLVTIVFISCSKPTAGNEREISYDIAGNHQQHLAASGVKFPGNLAIKTFYQFSGITNSTNSVIIMIVTDSLKTGATYHLIQGTGSTLTVNNESYTLFKPDDYLDVTITEHSGGKVNGTFSGKLSKAVSLNPLVLQQQTISAGVIKNVSVIY